MAGVTAKSFSVADERRATPSTTVDVVHLRAHDVARLTFQPGWRWSEHVAGVMGTRSCLLRHVGTVLSGRLHVAHADGSGADIGVGDAYVIEPDHDAWVVGDDPAVVVEFESAEAYARAPTAGIDFRNVYEND